MSDSTENEVNTISSEPTPLVYPSPTEGQTQYNNVLLICSEVQDYQTFVDSANSSTFPIVYSVTSSKTELLGLLRSKFTNISRLCLIFNSSGGDIKMFLDMEPLFSDDNSIINENTQFIIDTVKEFQVKNIDYLACNTLNYPNWVNYYETLKQNTGVTLGASDDRTGNIKYGGDWLLESTNEDIESVYFTQNIQYYQYLLDTITVNNIVYTYDTVNKTAYVSGNTLSVGATRGYIILSSVTDSSNNSYPVTSIGNSALTGLSNVTSVVIPNSVTSIGNGALNGYASATSIVIPNSVISIGNNAFSYTNFWSVTIPNSVVSLGDSAFASCNATSITIPNSVTSIGNSAFLSCAKLTTITLPDSITNSAANLFMNCAKLENVILPKNFNAAFGGSLFAGCSNLKRVVLPKNTTSVYSGIFANCSSLTSIIFPALFTGISGGGYWFLSGCTSLTNVYIPAVNGLKMVSPSSGPVYFYRTGGTTGDLMNPGYPVNLLIPLTAKENYVNGITVTTLYDEFKFTTSEMYDNGNGISIANLIAGGLSILQLYNGGISVAQLISNNLELLELYNAGITILQLYNGGVTTAQLYAINITVAQLISGGLMVAQIYNGGVTVSQLISGGVSVLDLYYGNITVLQLYNGGVTVQQLYDAGIPQNAILNSNICFPAGTPVSTNQGKIPIELIDPEIHTICNNKIVGITQTISPDKYLVCFEKDALGLNKPSQKTIISKNHELFYKGKMVKAKDFIGKFENVKKIKYTGEVLYNVLMEEHDKMMVNNLICETLNPENTVAQLYMILQTLTPEKQVNVIKQYNEHIIKEKIYSSKKLNK